MAKTGPTAHRNRIVTTNRRTVATLVEWSTASWMSVENPGFPDELLPARGLIILDSRGLLPSVVGLWLSCFSHTCVV